jgi:hypothetical protein
MVIFTDKRVKPGAFKGINVHQEIGSIRNKSTSLFLFFKGQITYVEGRL